MRIRVPLAAAAVILAGVAPAYAFQCPSLVGQVDKELASADGLSAAEVEEITRMRDDGDAKHQAGQHGDAIKVLNEALAKLKDAGGSSSTGSGYQY